MWHAGDLRLGPLLRDPSCCRNWVTRLQTLTAQLGNPRYFPSPANLGHHGGASIDRIRSQPNRDLSIHRRWLVDKPKKTQQGGHANPMGTLRRR